MVEIYKRDRTDKVAENTINNEINTLSGIFTKAIEWGKALVNPVHKIKRFRIKERKRILEQWEQESLINRLKPPPLVVVQAIWFYLWIHIHRGNHKKLHKPSLSMVNFRLLAKCHRKALIYGQKATASGGGSLLLVLSKVF